MDKYQNQQKPAQSQQAEPTVQAFTVHTQVAQTPAKKPSKWRYFLIALGLAQIFGVAIFIFIMTWLSIKANAGVSGTEFIAMIIFAKLAPTTFIIALINIVGLTLYMIIYKPKAKSLIFSIFSLIISTVLVAYGLYAAYQTRVVAPKRRSELRQQYNKDIEAKEKQYDLDNANPEITKDEAIDLLQACQLKGFYYTNQTKRHNGGWGELSSTGVVLTKSDGKPYRISVADRLVPELAPVAREAQRTCSNHGPQFWHDGYYEQFKDGAWHFKGSPVK